VKKIQSAMADLSTYNSKFESLLAMLTQTIRLVQETEVISHGYTRYTKETHNVGDVIL